MHKITKLTKPQANSGFTLAEVLLVLTIIGSIASLVIPNLIQDIQNSQYKTAWKKNFSAINQAMIYIAQDNAGSIAGQFSNHNTLRDLFLTRLVSVRKCDTFTGYPNPCWSNPITNLNGVDVSTFASNNQACGVLLNGANIRFNFGSATCTGGYAVANNCGSITIDVNGHKGPNIIGKDIYVMYITKDRIIPAGAQVDTVGNHNPDTSCIEGSTDSGNTGYGCSTKYLKT